MLRLKGLSKYYHDKTQVVQALASIDLTFTPGEFVVVTGESGSGKSTLLNVISGLDTYEAGELFINGNETAYYSQGDWERYRKETIGFIFQHYNLIESYSVLENIEVAAFIQGEDKQSRLKKARDLAEKVGLKGKEKQKASTLSGGEKQRVAIARALAKDAPVLIADEPTGNLDEATSKEILELLKTVGEDRLVIVVSHSFERMQPYATRHVRLHDGEVVLDKTLASPSQEEGMTPPTPRKLAWGDLFALAMKNLRTTPKKTLFTLLIAVFVVGVFASVYGSYVQQAYTLEGFSASGFANDNENRLIVTNVDGSAFDEATIHSLEQTSGVLGVAPFDVMMDINYEVVTVNDSENHSYTRGYPKHAVTLSQSNLSEGRLPQNADEVVVSTDALAVGDTIVFQGVNAYRHEESAAYAGLPQFEVVGKIQSSNQWQSDFFFHEDHFSDAFFIGRSVMFSHDMRMRMTTTDGDETEVSASHAMRVDGQIDEGVVRFHANFFDQAGLNAEVEDYTYNLVFNDRFTGEDQSLDVIADETLGDAEGPHQFSVHPATIAEWFEDYPAHQVTVFVEDAFGAEQVENTLDLDTYNTLYPAGIGDPFANMMSIIMNLFMAVVSIIVAAVMYFVAYLALKNVMSAKRKDYIIMRSMGLYRPQLSVVNLFEMVTLMVVAMMLVIGVFTLGPQLGFTALPNFFRYFSFGNYLFMSIVLIILSTLLSLRFNRNIFSGSVISVFKEQ